MNLIKTATFKHSSYLLQCVCNATSSPWSFINKVEGASPSSILRSIYGSEMALKRECTIFFGVSL
ncbi:hypothetical protein LR48_Vigan01g110500 [Vigna angularis]|uniref:Uncharacterized protein n=1 Tax=Phaseolus angularis TaxID=3914 RepID=A0A0L9TLW8_PHAAN|nr:hypothetical protein LR48_Vigan01g110500 [Vigna angularis]